MVFSRYQLRRWATFALLAWLFGIATSFANACALRLPSDAAAALVEHAGTAEHHHSDDHEDDSQANCLDFCQEWSVAAASWQSAPDPASLAWLPATLISVVLPAPSPTGSHAVSAWHEPTGGPPIPIAYLRLAL